MLFVGDILQLQPVSGSAVFEYITQKTLLNTLGCAASINIWRDSVTYDELTINERPKSDAEFADILDCVRRGCPTDQTNDTLQQRTYRGLSLTSLKLCVEWVSHLFVCFPPEIYANSSIMKC